MLFSSSPQPGAAHPLSAAQPIGTDGRLTRWDEQGDVQELRRIEIRMRKST
jgi:hypothetical protein